MKRLSVSLIALATLVTALAATSLIVVDESEYVIVTSFGQTVAVYGDEANEAGLHMKRPWETALRIDRRLQFSDPPQREVITGDKKNLEVASYILWSVRDPRRFIESTGTLEAAQARLEERISAALSSTIGRHPLEHLVSTDSNQWRLDAVTAEILAAVAGPAREELGVEVVDVRLRRFNHPIEVRPAVFDLIRSERRQVAATLRAEGEADYKTLTSQADRERDALLAQADAEAERVRGQADAEATRLLNEAQARDPRFAEFLRTLDAYKSILDENTTVVLSASSPLLRLLTRGPGEDLMKGAPLPEGLIEPTTAEGRP